jgi:hypothetical protein
MREAYGSTLAELSLTEGDTERHRSIAVANMIVSALQGIPGFCGQRGEDSHSTDSAARRPENRFSTAFSIMSRAMPPLMPAPATAHQAMILGMAIALDESGGRRLAYLRSTRTI